VYSSKFIGISTMIVGWVFIQFTATKAKTWCIKRVLLDIAKGEKIHVGEFQALLFTNDKEREKELEEGKKEVDELSD
jgi:rubrerythrin